jgi:hypothetical protein
MTAPDFAERVDARVAASIYRRQPLPQRVVMPQRFFNRRHAFGRQCLVEK